MTGKVDPIEIEHRLELERNRIGAEVLDSYPVAEYVGYFDAMSDYGGYGRIPVQAAEVCKAIEGDLGRNILESYHRFVLLSLVGQHPQRSASGHYPPEILACFERHFNDMVSQMEHNPTGFYLHSNDKFSKDFAVCRHKLIPCGAQLVDVRAGVPRSIAVRQAGIEGLRFFWYMLSRVGGFRPFYEMHMDPRLILEFNVVGWERCYVRIARLLEYHPEVIGVVGTSWWNDPKLQDISPRLNYLREIPTTGGARFFKVGSSEGAIRNAMVNSRERQQAYESGVYQPTDWVVIWSSKDLIAWAERREC